MKGHADIIQVLNDVLEGELTAINQYFLHARMCQDWGYMKLAGVMKAESIDEMKHAQELIDRILLLEGLPNLQKLGALRIGQNVKEQLEGDLALENEAIPRLRKGVDLCTKHGDHGTRDLLEKILVSEEEHVDWLEAQLHMVEEVGISNYLSQQMNA